MSKSKKTFANKIVKNIKSPKNESKRIEAYKKIVGMNGKHNGDISSVKTKDGTKGMAILPNGKNRSRDKNWHRGKKFVHDSKINKTLKKKK